MTREQFERADEVYYDIRQAENSLEFLRGIDLCGPTTVTFGKYGSIRAGEDLLKRLIAVCIAHNENKLSRLEEELKKI
jgi:hypothetical protein